MGGIGGEERFLEKDKIIRASVKWDKEEDVRPLWI